jgi:hypothetical protein
MVKLGRRILEIVPCTVATIVLSGSAIAQGTCDGIWKGYAGAYVVQVQVSGANGRLHLYCGSSGDDWAFNISVGPDCSLSGWISSTAPNFERTQVAGRLPSFTLPSSKVCLGGSGTLKK